MNIKSLVLSLSALEARPWSPTDPMQPSLYQLHKNQKQRNLAKIQLMPRNAISFVGPRQATSLEADDEGDDYYGDDYEAGNGNAAVEYTESEEVDDDYGWR
ncbi:hypothetical protein AWZ03_006344 [Drosophila navojoa]|uniref:Uncharacterized protein n=1 Tax=Drosophila navojoa TaxID=7232 RepID=A0A484BEK4_DRONA|nr:hypothetical protein AWZ03_006344 [Drosophila navojoa]